MNEDLIEIIKKKKSNPDEFQDFFKDDTREILKKFIIVKSLFLEKDIEIKMMAYILGGVLSLGCDTIDEAIVCLDKINEQTKEILCTADSLINKGE